jgi:HTH-type transcriptional regulator / antitoxin HigA
MEIRPIRTEADCERGLRRVEFLWGAAKGSPEGDELEVLVTLIEAYERQAYPIDLPTPIAAIQFRLEQQGKDHRALIGVIGQRTQVYEVMRGDRPLSLNMIRNLHRQFEIPAEALIQPPRRSHTRKRASAEHRAKNRRSGKPLPKSA